jgi:hypothetical protein
MVVVTGLAPNRFLGVGAWELAGALATGFALWQENKKIGGQYAFKLD